MSIAARFDGEGRQAGRTLAGVVEPASGSLKALESSSLTPGSILQVKSAR